MLLLRWATWPMSLATSWGWVTNSRDLMVLRTSMVPWPDRWFWSSRHNCVKRARQTRRSEDRFTKLKELEEWNHLRIWKKWKKWGRKPGNKRHRKNTHPEKRKELKELSTWQLRQRTSSHGVLGHSVCNSKDLYSLSKLQNVSWC